jgi:hypothetical protein
MGDTLAFYLWKLILPTGLGPDYGRTPVWLMRHGWAYGMIAVPLAVLAIAWIARRRAPWAIVGAGIWLLSLLPVTGLTPFDFQQFSTVADRYMYFAMLGVAIAVSGALTSLPVRWTMGVGAALAVILTVLTVRQLPVWANTTALFTQGLRINPESSVSYLSIGHEKDAAGNLDGAIADYRQAVRFNPDSAQTQNNLGEALGHKWYLGGHSASTAPLLMEARDHLERSVRLRDNFPEAHANLGNIYFNLHRYADTLAQFQAALRYDPENAADQYMAGIMYAQLGDPSNSRAYLQKAADHGYGPAVDALKTAR